MRLPTAIFAAIFAAILGPRFGLFSNTWEHLAPGSLLCGYWETAGQGYSLLAVAAGPRPEWWCNDNTKSFEGNVQRSSPTSWNWS